MFIKVVVLKKSEIISGNICLRFYAKANPRFPQTSKIVNFAILVNGLNSLTIVVKRPIGSPRHFSEVLLQGTVLINCPY